MKYLFGPVNSRRLGLSLGIDLIPFKTCTLNCIYCECGETTNLVNIQDEYVPVDEVIKELDDFMKENPELDVITFAGSGEPTLNSGIGRVINHIKENYPDFDIVVLTNGTLLWKEDVRKALLNADIVMPSVDAVSDDIFNKIGRPSEGTTSEKLIEGLVEFRKEFKGRLIIEIFIIPGLNDSENELKLLNKACEKIQPDEIHLNSLDRPGAEDWIEIPDIMTMERIKNHFQSFEVKIIGKPQERKHQGFKDEEISKMIIATLKRRPSTISDLENSLGVEKDIIKYEINKLVKKRQIEKKKQERGDFYQMISDL